MDELLLVRSMLDTARRVGLGAVSFGAMAVDTGSGLDMAFERALGLGALSLRAMVIHFRSWLGVDTWLRFWLSWIWL